MNSSLSGHTSVVTGGARGIGLAVARLLAARGARVVIVGRNGQRLQAACDAWAEDVAKKADRQRPEKSSGELLFKAGELLPLEADITEASWLLRLRETAPWCSVVVHSAMNYPAFGRASELTPEELNAPWNVAVAAAVRLVEAQLEGMRAEGFGRVVLVGSAAAEKGGLGQAPYAAAKAALGGLVRTWAAEWGRYGVTSNLVVPGLIDTERTRRVISEEVRKSVVAQTAAGRVGTVEDVATLVGFLVSHEASFINGAAIPVDGGLGLAPGLLSLRQ